MERTDENITTWQYYKVPKYQISINSLNSTCLLTMKNQKTMNKFFQKLVEKTL